MTDFSQGLQGAAGGAMAGSAFGPWGTAIGGGIGLLGGLFGGGNDQQNKYKDQLVDFASGVKNRQAPQAGPASQAGVSQFRGNQAGLISQLEAMARGEAPSAAAIQMREAMDRASSAQAGAAAGAGGRGVNPGAAYLNSANNMAALQAQGNRDTATLRAQEQANAMSQLSQTLGQARGADDQTSQFNAQANNQTGLANLQAQLQTLGLNDEGQLRALMGALGATPQQPGLGSQIFAGGASAFPAILQRQQGMAQMQQGNPQQALGPAPSGHMRNSYQAPAGPNYNTGGYGPQP